jgi:hypothetical protein
MRTLLVEDDALLGDGVKAGLAQAGFAVDWVRDGVAAELALRTGESCSISGSRGCRASNCCAGFARRAKKRLC